MIEPRSRGVLDPRRSLSSGAYSRDPVAVITVEFCFAALALTGLGAAGLPQGSLQKLEV